MNIRWQFLTIVFSLGLDLAISHGAENTLEAVRTKAGESHGCITTSLPLPVTIPITNPEAASTVEFLEIGPFAAANEADAATVDFLQTLGTSELADLDSLQHAALVARRAGLLSQVKAAGIVDLESDIPATLKEGVGFTSYLIGCIRSDSDRRYELMVGGNTRIKLLVNQIVVDDEIIDTDGVRIGKCIQVQLHHGFNVVICRVDRRFPAWMVKCEIAPSANAATISILSGRQHFLDRCIYSVNDHIDINIPEGPQEQIVEFALRDRLGNEILHERIRCTANVPLPHQIASELYFASVRCGDTRVLEPIIIGDPAQIVATLTNQVNSQKSDLPTNRAAYVRWLAYLMSATIARPASIEWQRMVAWAISRAENATRVDDDRLGMSLQSFRSSVDDSEQVYRAYVPHCGTPPYPMVVILPPVMSFNRPFINSPFLLSHREAEEIGVVAEKLGIAVLWPGYRCNGGEAPLEESYFDEAIHDFRRRYPIDPKRIDLLGVCTGARAAAYYSAIRPGLVRSLLMYNPEIRQFTPERDLQDLDPTSHEYANWATEHDPMRIAAADKTPVFIIHDGSKHHGGDVPGSLSLLKTARFRRMSVDIVKEQLDEDVAIGRLLEISTITSRPLAEKLDCVGGLDEERSVRALFSHRFTVACDDLNNSKQRGAALNVAKWLSESWLRLCHTNCRTFTGKLSASLFKSNENIVLVGTNDSQHCRDLLARNRLAIGQASVDIDGKTIRCDDPLLVASVPNPEAPEHRILLIVASDLSLVSLGDEMLPLTGWYGYAVYSCRSGESILVRAGMLADR